MTNSEAHARALHNRGVLLEQEGRFAEAIQHYETVRRLKPTHLKSLARLIALRPDDACVKNAEQLLATAAMDDDDRSKLHQGLGKYYDRQRCFDQAFGHFSAAKDVLRKHSGEFDAQALAGFFDALIESFSAGHFASARHGGSSNQRPVFIVGMPRSGTTLTEQILASHPSVFGAGELKGIPEIVKALQPGYPQCVASMDARQLQGLALSYERSLEGVAPAAAIRVTDKLPVNFMHLGLIATLFPNARVIHCRRDPIDTALSCFIELFKLKRDFTTDIRNIGQYYLQYERLMAHWSKVLPLPLHEQRYEALVADPEAGSRELIASCGLPWDDACLNFQGVARAITTPSRWQVRQPIYSTSIGRWRNYERQLEPLRRLLSESEHSYMRAGT